MLERERQTAPGWPTIEELVRRKRDGWNLVAIDWEREASADDRAAGPVEIEIPYGFRAATDGFHMVDEPSERQALMIILDSIVDDRPLSHAAADLNRAGIRDRQGREWTAATVFELLPRLIEASPAIFASQDWIARRERNHVRR